MEQCETFKNKDISKLSAKWMEIKNIIEREITQIQKETWYVLTYKWSLAINEKIIMLQYTDP